MALVVKDRVKVTTATTGTGTLTLGSAVAGFQAFSAVLSNADTTYYAIFESSTGAFEVGLGTYASPANTLARTTILESSNAGSAINLTAGDADVFVTQPAEKAVYLDASGYIFASDGRNLTNLNASNLSSGTISDARLPATITSSITGNAATATAWATGRTLSLTGDVTGTSASFDGTGNISLSTTIAANSVALGTDTTGNYVAVGATSGNGISGAVSSEGGTFTVTSNATNANTGSTIVFRDASGNFSAGTITANLTGTASNANTLDSLDSADFSRFSSGGTISNALASAAWVADYNSVSNVDHVWHDDGANAWNFNSDTSFKAAANSRVNAGSFYAGGNVVWNAGNDGAGSGLDADLWDGNQFSSFLNQSVLTTSSPTFSAPRASNRLAVGTTPPRLPSANIIEISGGTSSFLMGVQDGSGRVQMRWNASTGTTPTYLVTGEQSARYEILDVTQPTDALWRIDHAGAGTAGATISYTNILSLGTTTFTHNGNTVWNAGNDGSGSGLDADTVDGLQASQFLRSDVADSTASTITFSGDIEVGDQILHNGDTDTYMQFHGANLWRVVTGGVERIEASSSGIRIDDAFTLPTTDGTSGQAMVTNGSGTVTWESAGISTGKAIAMAIVFG